MTATEIDLKTDPYRPLVDPAAQVAEPGTNETGHAVWIAGVDYATAPKLVLADVSPEPWDGPPGPGNNWQAAPVPGREFVAVPPVVSDYVIRAKKAAVADLAGFDAILATFAPTMVAAVTAGRTKVEDALNRRATAHAHIGGGEELNARETAAYDAVTAMTQPDVVSGRADIKAAAKARADETIEWLKDCEYDALKALDELGAKRTTEADYRWALDMAQTLGLMGPRHSVPLLMNAMVLRPAARDGEGLGRAQALLPILKGLYDSGANGYHAPEVEDVIRLAEVVLRDAKWYAAHMKLRVARRAMWQVRVCAEEYVARDGQTPMMRVQTPQVKGQMQGRSAFAELGIK